MKKIIYDVDVLMKGGPYSHIVEAGGLLFMSGIVPTDSEKKLAINDDVKAATELVLTNKESIRVGRQWTQ
jgi:enamine deaminase RidA (YjgF/YER057c/UK114 family)